MDFIQVMKDWRRMCQYIHYCACQAWNIGHLANALSTTCANFETTQMFLLALGIEPKEG